MDNNLLKLKIIKAFLWITGIILFFWWPLSHWFYPDFYHRLLGFETGTYQDSMVKVIGTTGIVPVLLIIFSALDPIKNKFMIITLIVFSFLMIFTYLFLILTGQFPELEYINAGLLLFFATFLIFFYPWKYVKL